jgi:hypothetical protein
MTRARPLRAERVEFSNETLDEAAGLDDTAGYAFYMEHADAIVDQMTTRPSHRIIPTAAIMILRYEVDPGMRARAQEALAEAVEWRMRVVGPAHVPPFWREVGGEPVDALIAQMIAEGRYFGGNADA